MTEREEKLPKWARDELRRERYKNDALTAENKALRGCVGTSKVLRREAGGSLALTPVLDTEYTFLLDNGQEISVQRVDATPGWAAHLRVSSQHRCVLVTPQAGNVIAVRGE